MASKSMLIMTRTRSHDCAIKCPTSDIISFKKNERFQAVIYFSFNSSNAKKILKLFNEDYNSK